MGDKAGLGVEQVRSSETTVTIKKGSPVFLTLSGTENGLRVISVENLANALWATFFGLALTDIAPGALGETILYGYFAYARWVQSTRPTSTDVWVSYSAGAIGDVAGFRTTTGGDQALTRSVAAAATSFMPAIVLAETYASQTTQASSLGGTSTVSISTLKVFLRAI